MSVAPDLRVLPTLPVDVARLRLTVQAQERIALPFFAGSMLRGAYGHALRRLVCMTGLPACDGCPLRTSCPFPRLFDPFGVDVAAVGLAGGSAKPPPPFAIDPPPLGSKTVEPGQPWTIGVRLFGKAIRDLPLVIEAWRRALSRGLGALHARGLLVAVECWSGDDWLAIYDPDTSRLEELPPIRSSVPTGAASSNLVITFVTPLRLQSNARRLKREDISARRLVSDAVRRARLVVATAGGPDAQAVVAGWPVRAWLEEAEHVGLTETLRWVDWTRHSNRQGQTMTLGGWLGTITVSNASEAVLAALALGELTGLGKETVFGFGQYSLSARH